jgi:glutamyl-tRNA synthetase
MSNTQNVRVRFAPSPTGYMHLGNVRAALINFLFARKHNGTFILRIEDTDAKRNFDPRAQNIISDLQWLGLEYDEGPVKGGPCKPYTQSERCSIYDDYLNQLKEKNRIYRCFCTPEELDRKRARQKELKQPPRYDRTCMKLSEQDINQKCADNTPFVWRFKLEESQDVTICDLARDKVVFNLSNFSDFPVTRQDGSYTFMFANFVDDMTMNITHIFRGEDHLTNTAGQAALYKAFDAQTPIFFHLPIMCNIEGKKLSKRDFGFALQDLKHAGYLPEAINNYLTITGGSFAQEIMNMNELISAIQFETLSCAGHMKYDVEKLNWVNQEWIKRLSVDDLCARARPFLEKHYDITSLDADTYKELVTFAQKEMVTLQNIVNIVSFYFEEPQVNKEIREEHTFESARTYIDDLVTYLTQHEESYSKDDMVSHIKSYGKEHGIPLKKLFILIRVMLTGHAQGTQIQDLLRLVPPRVMIARFKKMSEDL